MKIDMHTHLMPADFPDFSKKFGYGDFIKLEHHRPGFANMIKGDHFFREIEQNCWDAELRIEAYAKLGVDIQVICTIPVLFAYWAKPAHGLEVSQFLNDHIAEICDRFSANYIGLGTLPMQDNTLAIKELERCKAIGMRGVQIGSNVNQKNLSEPEFFPIFEAAQDLDMSILVHPWEMMGEDETSKYWLPWLVGMPAETSRAVCSMIFGGVLEKLPRLRCCFAHAGGSFLPTLGRIEHGFKCRPDLVAVDNAINPRDYLGKFWVDSVTHDPDLLEYILKMVGPTKITFGSDYPFPLGDLEMGRFIDDMDLPKSTKNRIFRQNTLDWLGLQSN